MIEKCVSIVCISEILNEKPIFIRSALVCERCLEYIEEWM